jgi:hypothetical protein
MTPNQATNKQTMIMTNQQQQQQQNASSNLAMQQEEHGMIKTLKNQLTVNQPQIGMNRDPMTLPTNAIPNKPPPQSYIPPMVVNLEQEAYVILGIKKNPMDVLPVVNREEEEIYNRKIEELAQNYLQKLRQLCQTSNNFIYNKSSHNI